MPISYTRQQLIDIINAGKSVIISGVVYAKEADLPTDEQIAASTLADAYSNQSPKNTVIGSSAPTTTPSLEGLFYLDTTANKMYISTGTTSSGDWTMIDSTRVIKGNVTINPASVAANTVSSQTFTLTGALTTDAIILNPPTTGLTAGLLVLQVFVSAADTITVVFFNTTGAAIDEASGSWKYSLLR